MLSWKPTKDIRVWELVRKVPDAAVRQKFLSSGSADAWAHTVPTRLCQSQHPRLA